MTHLSAILDRARGYPYAIPDHSYVWRGGKVAAFDPSLRNGRHPVLAIGSNQSPEQLTRKFGDRGEIPVQRAALKDFDVYYSAHISQYGAVPAMLQRAPGTEVTLAVTWLDDRQLDIMHGTELSAAKYEYAVIEDIRLGLDCGTALDFVHLYIGVNGHLMHEGDAIALSAMAASGPRPRSLTTAEVLELVRKRFSPADDPEGFVLRLAQDSGFRAACSEAISADAVSFAHPARPAGQTPGAAMDG